MAQVKLLFGRSDHPQYVSGEPEQVRRFWRDRWWESMWTMLARNFVRSLGGSLGRCLFWLFFYWLFQKDFMRLMDFLEYAQHHPPHP